MKAQRLLAAGGMAGLAGLMFMPVSAAHAQTGAQTWQGTARASALTVTLNPDVVFGANSLTAPVYNVLQPLLQQLTGTSSLGAISVSLDQSNALGILNKELTDLASGHADSQALDIQVHLLDGLIGKLNALLAPLNSAAAPLTQLLSGIPTVGPTLATVTSALSLSPTDFLRSLGVNVNGVTQADYNNAPAANVPQRTGTLIDLKNSGLPAALTSLQLAPFVASALPNALAPGLNLNGGQAEAHNTTTALDIIPSLGALKLGDLTGLLNALTSLKLSDVISQALAVVPQGTTAVTGALAGTPLAGVGGLVAPVTTIVGGVVTPVVQTVGGVTTTVASAAPLTALQGQLTALITNLGILSKLQGLLGNGLSLADLVKTSGVTSTAMLHPNANQVESIATTKLVSVDVLPLATNLTSILGALPGGLSLPGGSLLHIEGVDASAQTILGLTGNNSAFKDATSNLSRISVLGKELVGPNGLVSVDQLLQGLQKPIDLGPLQVIITRGLGTKLDTASERKSTISALDIAINVGGNGLSLLPNVAGSSVQPRAIAAGTSLLHVQLGTVASDVSVVPTIVVPPTSGGPTNGQTGMFGTGALVGGAGLAGVAILMQVMPKVAARRRRDA